MNRIGLTLAVVATLVTGSAWGQSRAGAARVDFDDQLIQGQVNKGAVHLIERKDADLGSLVKKRTSYRKEILAGTDVTEAKPSTQIAAAAIPVALPVVKASELKGDVEMPAAKPVVAPAVPASKTRAVKAPAKKVPAKKVVPAVKAGSKQSKNKVGGSRG